jgi:hypothetical protein
VAGRFPLYTDADVHGPVVKALQSAEWDVLRGIAAYPEKTRDDIHFARAAKEQRVLVSNDLDMKMLAETWFLEGRIYRGLVWWPRSHYSQDGPRRLRGGLRGPRRARRPFRRLPDRPHQAKALSPLQPAP